MNKVLTAAALTLVYGVASAQDNTFDPRSLAMGGTGVTTSNPSNAAFHNAAMLSSPKDKNEDDFALELPIIGIRIQDENSLQNDISNLKTNGNNLTNASTAFQTALNNYQAAPSPATLAPLQTSAQAVSAALGPFGSSLSTIDHKTITGNALVGALMSIPSQKHAFSLYLDERIELGAMFSYASADQQTINTLATSLNACAAGTAASCTTAGTGIGANGQVTGLASHLQIRGVKAKDIGIAIARHFDSLGGVDVGIVPKITQFSTYDFALAAQNNPKLSLNQGQKDYSAFNVDMGVVKTFGPENGDRVKAGLAVKDIMSKSFTTVLGNTVDIKPTATAGVAYVTKLTTTGLDLDLMPNQPMITGLVKDSQFLRVGTEFDAWGWMQVRLGYRHDLKGNYVGLPSVGLGLSPFGGVVHFDLSAAYASKKEAALSLQLGSRF